MAASVRQRQGEIGARLALGATAGDVRRLVLGEGLRLALAGIAFGLALTVIVTGALKSLLFEINRSTPSACAPPRWC
jgi:putative ABC transport system permease protein